MNVKNETRVNVFEHVDKEKYLIFGYTPTCGTCIVSERRLDIANEILKLPITKIDLNFHPDFSQQHEIHSVPKLMLMSNAEEQKRMYALQSVPYLLKTLKLLITNIELNFHTDFSQQEEIQSVPILMLMSKGEEQKRIYAFQSVPYLLENLK